MKILFALLFLSIQAHASFDESPMRLTTEKLPKKQFLNVIRILQSEFQSYAEVNGRKLEFFTDYAEDWAQAFARRWETDQVIVYGGIAALKGGTEDSLALVLCHELGHLYGGSPYGDGPNKLALEGQADYWSTSECFKKISSKLPSRTPSIASLKYCSGEEVCARTVDAGLVITSFYADNRNNTHPKIETPDISVVGQMLKVHPEPQCRLDTILAGLMKKPRPACWFFYESFL